MLLLHSVALALSAITVQTFISYKNTDPPLGIWHHDVETQRKMIHEKLAHLMVDDGEELNGDVPTNRSWDEFIDKYLISPKEKYRSPDNWTVNNLIDNNEYALFRPYVIEDYVKKYGIDTDENEGTDKSEPQWTFKDFVEKYEPMAACKQLEERIKTGDNLTYSKELIYLVDSMDSTDELLSLPVPWQSGRRWRHDFHVPETYKKLKGIGEKEDIQNILLFMKQAIYEAREKMVLMQTLREQHRKSAVYKMGYIFAKTDYACKIFSSLSFKFYRTCSLTRQKIFGEFRLYQNIMDLAYNIERLEARWFDIDLLKDILVSNDVLARKIILRNRNLTSPAMVVKAFDEMFID